MGKIEHQVRFFLRQLCRACYQFIMHEDEILRQIENENLRESLRVAVRNVSRICRDLQVAPSLADCEERPIYIQLNSIIKGQQKMLEMLQNMSCLLQRTSVGVNAAFKVFHKRTDCVAGSDNAMQAFVEGNNMTLVCLARNCNEWNVKGWDISKKP